MITQEMADLIRLKKWDELARTTILAEMSDASIFNSGFTVTKDFLFDFIFNKELYKKALNKSKSTNNVFTSSIFQYIEWSMDQTGINKELSADDWEFWSIMLIDYSKSKDNRDDPLITRDGFTHAVSIKWKPVNYLRMLMKPTAYLKIIKNTNKACGAFDVDQKIFDGLTKQEMIKAAYLLTLDCPNINLKFGNIDQTLFQDFGSPKEVYKWLQFETRVGVSMGSIYSNLSVDDYEKMLKSFEFDNVDLIGFGVIWLTYYIIRDDVIISDDMIKYIKNLNDNKNNLPMVVKSMTREQVIENFDDLPLPTIIKNPNITLGDLDNMRPYKYNTDIVYARFFTEEEIIEYPHYFDPEALMARSRAYVSKDTFKLLNKTWGKKQRYSTSLISFANIMRANSNHLTIDTMKYLAKKTGVDNLNIMTTLKNMNTDDAPKKIKDMADFIEKYKDYK